MKVAKLHDYFAAEISGISFQEEPPIDVKRELMRLLAEHKILLFRDQWLDNNQLVRFGQIFGRLWGLEDANDRSSMVDGNEYIYLVSDKGMLSTYELNWHSDHSWVPCADQPARILYGVNIDSSRINTPVAFMDLQAAYDSLQPQEQQMFRACLAVYKNKQYSKDEDVPTKRNADNLAMSRPLVRRHPYTGRLGLNDIGIFLTARGSVSYNGTKLAGDSLREIVTGLLKKQKQNNAWEHVYRVGDLLIHDNLSTMHARPQISGTVEDRPSRELKRLTVDVLWHQYA